MRVTVTYELTNPTDAHAYKCSQRAVEALYMIETISEEVSSWLAHRSTSEGCLMDIHRVLLEWKRLNDV
jgi:hypothetical protein